MSDWKELVGVATASALAIFGGLWLSFADFSTVQSGTQSIELFITAVVLSVKPTGLSLAIDAVAAAISGVVSFKTVGQNIVLGLFGFVFVYSFLSITVNYFFVAPNFP